MVDIHYIYSLLQGINQKCHFIDLTDPWEIWAFLLLLIVPLQVSEKYISLLVRVSMSYTTLCNVLLHYITNNIIIVVMMMNNRPPMNIPPPNMGNGPPPMMPRVSQNAYRCYYHQ